jgi:hypothetical protein
LKRLHAQLIVNVPGYRVTDVTEKLGGLRIHVTTGEQAVPEAGWCPAEWCNSDLRIAPGHGAAIAQLSE